MSVAPTYEQLRHRARRVGLRVVTKGDRFMVVDPGNGLPIAGNHPEPYSLSAHACLDFLAEVD